MREIRIHSIVFLVLILSLQLPGQNKDIRFSHLDVNDGLSQNQVFSIYADSKGLLWFATQDGLNMYDGYTFRVFRHQPGNENSLLDYAVNTICETDTGIFWIGTREGMSRLDLKKGEFTHYVHNPDSQNSLVDNNVWLITNDSEGHLWIATRNGMSRFDPSTKRFSNYTFSPTDTNSISNNFVFAIVEDSYKNIWIGGRGGLDRYDLKTSRFYNYKIYPDHPKSIALNGITSLSAANNILWVGSYSGLYNIDLEKIDSEPVIFKKHLSDTKLTVRSIFTRGDENVWVGTMGQGLYRYNPFSGQSVNYKNSSRPGAVSEDRIMSLYQSEDGVLWIGTSSSGLNKFNISSERFRTISFPDNSLSGNFEISAVTEDHKGNLWVGTSEGKLIRVNGQFSGTPELKYYNTDKNPDNYFGTVEIRSIVEDDKGNIWAGSFGNGIYLINPVSDKVTKIKHERGNDKSLSNDFIHSIYKTDDGTIWIGTGAGGLNRFNTPDNSFTSFKHNPDDTKSLSRNEVTAVCEDDEGYIWAGTSLGGLNRYDRNKEEFDNYLHDNTDISSISSNRIICLFTDSRSNLWIGTFGGGLNKWLPDKKAFEHYNTVDGLASNIVNSIVEDSDGNLWISTDKGISVFNVSTKAVKNYDVNDGLRANMFLQGAGYRSKINGYIYFGSSDGLNFFKPENLYINNKSDIVFTDFKIFNKSVFPGEGSALKTNILYSDEVTLSYDQNFITFEFASLDYNNPQKNQYAYKMEGFNREWINAGSQRYATYTNLDPGEYTFRVRASNSSGIWNEEGISMHVILLPPWWQTWWAYLMYAAAIMSILLFFRQFELKRIKLRNELQMRNVEAKKLQEIDRMKSQFFANISHEFRTPLTLILGLTEKLSSGIKDIAPKKDFGIIKKNANRLLHLINQLLELSKLETGNVELRVAKYDINVFLKRVLSSFTSIAERKNMAILINDHPLSEAGDQKEVFLYFDPEKFETIFYNLIGNAIKFSPEGEKIEVEVIPHIHNIDIRVTNTGVGIQQENLPYIFNRFYQVDETSSRGYEGTGIGLALVKELVEIHDGQINVMSIEDKETTFTLRIPVGRAHYKPEQVIDEVPLKEEEIIHQKAEDYELVPEVETPYRESDKTASDEAKSKIILIVEDNLDLRNYISEQLEEKYTVFEAGDGVKGLEMANEIIPDLIISDIMMPKMDGYEMCRKIKNSFKTSHIPIIMLTARAELNDKLEGLERGADDYLLKPFDAKELSIRVKNLIRIREQLSEKCRTEMLLKPADISVPSSEKVFVERLTGIINENISNDKFGVDSLSSEMGLSRSQLHRKLKAITDQSTTEFIRNFRLQRAADLIRQRSGNMAEIAYEVGFSSQAYFTKSFTEFFGLPPGEFRKKNQQNRPDGFGNRLPS